MKRSGRPMSTTEKGSIVIGIIFFILGVAIIISAALGLEYMMAYCLGPGFLPFWYGIALTGLSIAVVIQTLFGEYEHSKSTFPVREDRLIMAILLAIVVGTIIFMKVLGMVISIAIYLLLTMKFVERQSWKLSVLTSLIGTAVIYLVFCVGFRINFPAGIFGI